MRITPYPASRWQVFEEVEGEGLLLEPMHNVPVIAQVVALPDADWTPEMIAGVTDDLPANAQFARRLAKAGCRVVVPLLINRADTYSGNSTLGAMTNQPHREFILSEWRINSEDISSDMRCRRCYR